MNKYDAVKQLIEANSGDINLGEYGAGDGPSQLQIAIVQKLLGVTFPPSYIWWLNNYGGGELKVKKYSVFMRLREFPEVILFMLMNLTGKMV